MRRALQSACLLIGLGAMTSGCAVSHAHRNLIVTEVGKRQIELYLDEPADQTLKLGRGMLLTVSTSAGNTMQVDFGSYDYTLPGGSFLMIWEQGGYTGPPVREDYPSGQTGAVPGLKVAQRFFDEIDEFPAELRLHGSHSRATGLIAIIPHVTEDHVDDVLRFGDPAANRPATGGLFQATGALGYPTGSVSLQRIWTANGPRDTDSEDDWKHYAVSWGVQTP